MTAALAPGTTHPAPTRVVVRRAPRREPPYDDELTEPSPVGRWDQLLPFEAPPAPRPFRWAPPRPDGLVDPAPWTRLLLVGLIESAGGRRPLHQLQALMSMSVARGLSGEFERAARSGRPHWLRAATVRGMRSSEPAEGIAELSATLDVGPRVRAVAVRLEVRHGRWCCTRLQLG